MKAKQQSKGKSVIKAKTNTPHRIFSYWQIFLILIATTIIYYQGLNNQFILNWDDSEYIHANPYIKNLSFKGIYDIFTSFFFSNYHPLTTLSWAIEFALFEYNPFYYHLTNLLLHLANIVLVYYFVKKISNNKHIIIFVTAIFALHPMHVESVAWISERKDLLYTFFFLISLIFYLQYINKNSNTKSYILCLLFFILSLLSKSAAVVLTPLLFLIDYYFDKSITLKSLLAKVPFLVLSVLFGVIAIYSQEKELKDISVFYSFIDRIFIISTNATFYIYKFLFPLNLKIFYPYPEKINGFLPVYFYLTPIFWIIIAFFVIKITEWRKKLIFTIGFYLITLSMVLQLVPVGSAIVAERYSYMPYIGIALLIGFLYEYFIVEKRIVSPQLIQIIFVLSCLGLSYLSFERVKIWYDDESLFSDAVKKNPQIDFLQNNLGVFYYRKQQYAEAIKYYDNAIAINGNYAGSYYNRGNCKYNLGDLKGAFDDYNAAIAIDSNYAMALANRGTVKSVLNDPQGAIEDCTRAIKIDSNFFDAYSSRGNAYLDIKEYEKAYQDFSKAIQLVPQKASNYYNRGNVLYEMKKIEEAVRDFSKCIELDPTYAKAYYNRGSIQYTLGKKVEACNDWEKALEYGYNGSQAMINIYCQ